MKNLRESAYFRKWKMLLSVCCLTLLVTHPVNAKEIEDANMSIQAYDACVVFANEYCICPELVMAIIERESEGDPNATNGSCKGIMQISEKWHADRIDRLGVMDIYDTVGNIRVGVDYLSELFLEYEDAATVLMVYHGEEDAVAKSSRGEISDYAKCILERSQELERLHEYNMRKGREKKCTYQSFGVGWQLQS